MAFRSAYWFKPSCPDLKKLNFNRFTEGGVMIFASGMNLPELSAPRDG
jgi:hypothetical protein